MPKFRKIPMEVQVRQTRKPEYLDTLEGIMEVMPQDYIVRGVEGEEWVVKPEWFHQAYSHLYADTYVRNPQELEAVELTDTETLQCDNGTMTGNKGDYKVTGTDGEQWFVERDIFEKTYEPVLTKGFREDHFVPKKFRKEVNTMGEHTTHLQECCAQIGLDCVQRTLAPQGIDVCMCPVHGIYAISTEASVKVCPMCNDTPDCPQGLTATAVELLLNLDPTKTLHNPQQVCKVDEL